MKFEIDDETGLIETIQGFDEHVLTETKHLEQLLKAVKKTQQKLEFQIMW